MSDASNLYDQNPTSSTYGGYGEGDMDGGGEQVASAIYVNEQLAAQTAVVVTKQNAIILQPSTPPLNPELHDMWIDNNVYPNVIYTWDGTQWIKASVTSPEEIGSYTTVDVDQALGDVRIDMDAVTERVSVNEGKLADGTGLFATISKSDEYQSDVGGKAQAAVDSLVSDLQDDDAIAQMLPKFARQSDLEATADSIQAKFTSSGGVNLLKNSVGYAGLLNWQVVSGAASQYIGADCVEAGSGLSISTGVIKQAVAATAGKFYTLTLKVKKGVGGTAYVKLSDGTNFIQKDFIATQAYDYTQVQIAGFIPANNTLIVELSATGATGAVFTAVMLNIGDLGLQWSHANGEMYNSAVTFDINGVKVNSSVYDGYTVMSPQEFSGYFRNNQGVMQKVFTLNKDVTEVAKLNITNGELTMGSLKAVYLNGGGHNGWAIIPSGL